METKKEQPLWKNEIGTYLILLILILPISMILLHISLQYIRARENGHLQLKMKAINNIVNSENQALGAAKDIFDQNLSKNLLLMTDTLKEFVTDKGYTGPRLFPDGFVVELKEDEVILPEEMEMYRYSIPRNVIEESLASEELRTCQLQIKQGLAEKFADLYPERKNGLNIAYETVDLSFKEIADSFIYVDMTSLWEYQQFIQRNIDSGADALEKVNQILGGATLVLNDRGDRFKLTKIYGRIGEFSDLAEMGISDEQIRQEISKVKVNGKSYNCIFSHPEQGWMGMENVILVQLLPVTVFGIRYLDRVLAISYSMILIFATMIALLFSTRRFVKKRTLTEKQAVRFRPRKLFGRMVNAAIAGALGIFLIALILQGNGLLHIELKFGEETLAIMGGQQEYADHLKNSTQVQARQEAWYVYYGRRMAELLSDYPELADQDRLRRYCEILDIDFIMLFDENGNESLCSKDYSGFTLSKGIGSNSSDFRRLLLGISSIVHDTSVDETTGLERQMIGVTYSIPEGSGSHGALIMALMPGQTRELIRTWNSNELLDEISSDDIASFIVDGENGEILYSSDAALTGLVITEEGLPEISLRDGYMDFGTIDDTRYFIISSRQNDCILLHAVRFNKLFKFVLFFAFIAAVLYILEVLVLLFLFFRDYDEEDYSRWAVVATPLMEEEITERSTEKPIEKPIEKPGTEDDDDLPETIEEIVYKKRRQVGENLEKQAEMVGENVGLLHDLIHWNEKLPEERAVQVFHTGLIILMFVWANFLMRKDLSGKGYNSMASFLLRGDWMKGPNLFAFSSILMVVTLAYIISLIVKWVLLIISNFMSGKGKTICKLIYSAVRYLSLFVSIYFVFHYLGFPIGTIVGSIGIVSLALSLGARDLAADVLAGLAIVFEKSFQVGDIVEIGGMKGIVQEIGIRSTRLRTFETDNDIIISNHSIDTIVNLTSRLSWIALDVNIPIETPIETVEAVMEKNLPEISKKCDKIVEPLYFEGITSFRGNEGWKGTARVTIGIRGRCREEDLYDVNLFVNREIILMLRREGIELR